MTKTTTQAGLLISAFVAFFGFVAVPPAHAYIDPSAGALLPQLLFGGVAGAAVVVKIFWASLFQLRTGSFKAGVEQQSPQENVAAAGLSYSEKECRNDSSTAIHL